MVLISNRFGGMSLIWKEDGEFVDSEEELSELRHGDHTIVIISVLFVVIVACYFFRRYRVDWFRRLSSPVAYLQKNFHHVAEFHDVSVRPTLLAIVHVHVIWGLAILISYIIFSNFSFFRSLATDSIIGAEYNLEPSNWYESKTEIPKVLPRNSPYDAGNLHVVTGASAKYYPRIINLVGSIQVKRSIFD